MTEIIADSQLSRIIEIVRDIIKEGELGGKENFSEIPIEFRRYVNDNTVSQLPAGINLYRGVRNGVYIDVRQLSEAGLSPQEVEGLVGSSASTPGTAGAPTQPQGFNNPQAQPPATGRDDSQDQEQMPRNQQQQQYNILPEGEGETQLQKVLFNLGQVLLEKYGIEIVLIHNKDANHMDGESLLREKVQIGGIKHSQKVNMILAIDSRFVMQGTEQQRTGQQNGEQEYGESKEAKEPRDSKDPNASGNDNSKMQGQEQQMPDKSDVDNKRKKKVERDQAAADAPAAAAGGAAV